MAVMAAWMDRVPALPALARLLGGFVFSAGATFAYLILASRRLGPEGAATFAQATFVLFAASVVGIPFSSAIALELGAVAAGRLDQAPARRAVARIEATVICGVGILCAGAYAGRAWLGQLLKIHAEDIFCTIVAIGGLQVVLVTLRGRLRGVINTRVFQWSQLVESGGRFIWLPATLSFDSHLLGWLAPYVLAQSMAIAVILAMRGAHHAARIDSAPIRTLSGRSAESATVRFIVIALMVAISDAIFQNLDGVFVKALFAENMAGAYGSVSLLGRLVGVLAAPFQVLIFPIMARESSADRRRTAAQASIFCFIGLVTPLVLGAVLFGEELVGLLLGQSFSAGGNVFPAVAAGSLGTFIAALIAQVLLARGPGIWLVGYVLLACAEVVALDCFPGSSLDTFAWAVCGFRCLSMMWLVIAVKSHDFGFHGDSERA